MNILLTGATGYIGKRLLPLLVAQGHHVICCVRDKDRLTIPEEYVIQVRVIEVDFLNQESSKVKLINLDSLMLDSIK